MVKEELTALMPSKYIIAVIGDANAGKSTTIKKVYRELVKRGKIKNIKNIWGDPDDIGYKGDVSLMGATSYGLTGIVSEGDNLRMLEVYLTDFKEKERADMILCACRKQWPGTYKAVAKFAWMYGYTIIWVDLSPVPGISIDDRTDAVAAKIANVF